MSKKKTTIKQIKENKSFLDNLKTYQEYLILVVLLLIPLFIFNSPYILEGKEPAGSDVIGSKGNTNLYLKYEELTGETVFWNPSLFGGMPMYNRISPTSIHIDSLIALLSNILKHFFWYFLLGGIGLFLFLRQIKIPWYASAVVAAAFIMLPDWQALLGHGHFSKLRAIMVLPWVLFTFDYFLEKKSWFSIGLFALAFSWLVRTHHYQIVFYGIIILVFLYAYPIVRLLIDKKYKEFSGVLLKLVIAVILTLMTSAQPTLATNEYAEYSTRGGNPVQLGDQAESAARTGGVSFEYATRWSLAPREIIDFFIPRFTGGTSGEIYDGDKYAQIKGQQVPGYWGEMPFTENYKSMGMILFLFALFGLVFYRKNSLVISLGIFIGFSILLAMGRHFPALYNLFYEYVPYFSKFRVPVMFAHITFIATYILAGFGLKAFFEELKQKDYKLIAIVFGGGILFLIIILMMKSSFAYIGPNEAGRYNPQTLELIKDIRMEFLTEDTIRVLILVALTGLIALGYIFGKIRKEIALVGILLFVGIELFWVTNRQVSKLDFIDETQLEQVVFRETAITKALQSQNDNMRALVISNDFQSNYYAYFYPTINGYSAIKLQVIQDIIDHNLFKFPTQDRLNWNVINMLNGKYIVSSTPLNYPFLQKITEAQERKEILYLNKNVQPKAWFVKEIKSFDSPENLVLFMNDFSFDPDSLALLVNPSLEKHNFTGKGSIEVIDYTPNIIELSIATDSEQFLVLSEVYYPKGWYAVTSDDKELIIEKTNHILRGVKVPAGNYTLTFYFEPQTYYTSMKLVWAGNIILIFLIIGGYFFERKKKPVSDSK